MFSQNPLSLTFGVANVRQAVGKGIQAAELAEEILRATPNW